MRLIIKQSIWDGNKDQPIHDAGPIGLTGVPRKGDHIKIGDWPMCEVRKVVFNYNKIEVVVSCESIEYSKDGEYYGEGVE